MCIGGYVHTCVFVCLSAYVYFLFWKYIYLHVHLSVCLSVWVGGCLSVCVCECVCVCICMHVSLSVCMCVHTWSAHVSRNKSISSLAASLITVIVVCCHDYFAGHSGMVGSSSPCQNGYPEDHSR